jgi:UDP-N-acetyl-D-mannosaminuronic acid dehydrogenase
MTSVAPGGASTAHPEEDLVTNNVEPSMSFEYDVVIVGGCGRAGLPLGIAFADRGLSTVVLDLNRVAVASVQSGVMPFQSDGAPEVLTRVIAAGTLTATVDASVAGMAEHLIIVIGTPVDEHHNPDPNVVVRLVRELAPMLVDGQHLVLRSTVYPGTTALIERVVDELGLGIDVSFCPERIAEGKAMTELYELPQLVSARTEAALDRAEKLFRSLTESVIRLQPEEAELAKLFTNAWRYIIFGTANQFFLMADRLGLNYERIREALSEGYPRAADMPRAGLTAGPCLMKDAMQLAALTNNNFPLGYAAMHVNEGLPLYLVDKLAERHPLSEMTVGLLGMAFKGQSDDTRGSLSYKLKRALRFRAKAVLCHDPYVTEDPELTSLEELLREADILVVGAPHRAYRSISFSGPILDIWGLVEPDA